MKKIFGIRTIGKLLCGLTFLSQPAYAIDETGDKRLANEEVVVFDNAHSEIPYRIPALTYTRDGKLIAVCDYRVSKADIGINNENGLWQIDEVMRVSHDDGKTWGPIRTVAQGNEEACDWRVAFGDPSIVADRESNEVLMGCLAGKIGYWGENRSTNERRQECVFFRSMDGGETWDNGTRVTDDIWNLYDGTLPGGESAQGLFFTSGKIMQSRYVKVGKYYRLYIAHPVRPEDFNRRIGTFVIYSDDFGRTWEVLGGTSTVPSVAQDESKVEELPDGSVLLNCRDKDGGRRMNVFTYTDAKRAEGKWGQEVMPSNMTRDSVNAVNGETLIVPAKCNMDGKSVFLILQSVPHNKARVTMGFFYKVLTGHTDYNTAERLGAGWTKGLKVTDTTACYSTMVLLNDGQIGLLYEKNAHNNGYDIVFQSLSLEEITGDKYSYYAKAKRKPFLK